jgi:hypothetical protein
VLGWRELPISKRKLGRDFEGWFGQDAPGVLVVERWQRRWRMTAGLDAFCAVSSVAHPTTSATVEGGDGIGTVWSGRIPRTSLL